MSVAETLAASPAVHQGLAVLQEGSGGSEGAGVGPILVGLVALGILIFALLGLLAFGKGREHS